MYITYLKANYVPTFWIAKSIIDVSYDIFKSIFE